MNVEEHLLVCLGEEGSEIAQDCSKALRFGIDDHNYLDLLGPSNKERRRPSTEPSTSLKTFIRLDVYDSVADRDGPILAIAKPEWLTGCLWTTLF